LPSLHIIRDEKCRLVLGGSFLDVVDHQNIDRAFLLFELEAFFGIRKQVAGAQNAVKMVRNLRRGGRRRNATACPTEHHRQREGLGLL